MVQFDRKFYGGSLRWMQPVYGVPGDLTLIGCTLGRLISHTVHANEAQLQGTLKKIADSGSITLGVVGG